MDPKGESIEPAMPFPFFFRLLACPGASVQKEQYAFSCPCSFLPLNSLCWPWFSRCPIGACHWAGKYILCNCVLNQHCCWRNGLLCCRGHQCTLVVMRPANQDDTDLMMSKVSELVRICARRLLPFLFFQPFPSFLFYCSFFSFVDTRA